MTQAEVDLRCGLLLKTRERDRLVYPALLISLHCFQDLHAFLVMMNTVVVANKYATRSHGVRAQSICFNPIKELRVIGVAPSRVSQLVWKLNKLPEVTPISDDIAELPPVLLLPFNCATYSNSDRPNQMAYQAQAFEDSVLIHTGVADADAGISRKFITAGFEAHMI